MPRTKTKTTALPFARYARVSRVGGRSGEGFISVPEQERKMRALAKGEGVTLTQELFKDEDRSGGTLDRPEFQRALGLIRTGELGGIVVAKLDRFSRDTADFLTTLAEIEQVGGRLLCGDGAATLRNGTDTFTSTVRMAAAALERDRRREDLAASVRSSIERGHHLTAPFGYTKANGKGSGLVPIPAEAKVVKLAFEARAEGASWAQVAAKMNETGVLPRPHKRAGKTTQGRWQHKTARQLVHRETYIGTAYSGEYRLPGAHPAIVEPELWGRAHRAKGTSSLRPTEGYLLTGLVRCASCGYVMSNGTQNGYRYLRCRPNQHAAGRCPAQVNVPAQALEEFVAEWFKSEWLTGRWAPEVTDEQVIAAELGVQNASERLRGSMRMRGLLGEDASETEIKLADEQLAEDRTALRDAEEELHRSQMAVRGVDLPPQLDADAFDAAPVAEKRRWLAAVLACVVVRRADPYGQPVGERVRIVGRDDAPTDSTRLIPFAASLRW
jgi:DNA invertase Pin-like site-specific DNA recombinase